MILRIKKSKMMPFPIEVNYAKARIDNPLFFVVGNMNIVVDFPGSDVTEEMIDTIIISEEVEKPLYKQMMDIQMGRIPQNDIRNFSYRPDVARRSLLKGYDKVELYQVIR